MACVDTGTGTGTVNLKTPIRGTSERFTSHIYLAGSAPPAPRRLALQAKADRLLGTRAA